MQTTDSNSPSPPLLPSLAHPIPRSVLPSFAPSTPPQSGFSEHDIRTVPLRRPKPASRKSSGTNIVPRSEPDIKVQEGRFSPNDARAMSPKRSSMETERLGEEARRMLHCHAASLQSGLNALAEKIETVKNDHDKLERHNAALQDYIGGLTKSMSKGDLTSKSGSRVKK